MSLLKKILAPTDFSDLSAGGFVARVYAVGKRKAGPSRTRVSFEKVANP